MIFDVAARNLADFVTITVEDYDKFSANLFLGQIEIPLAKFARGKVVQKSFKLASEESEEEEDLGSIEVSMHWINTNADAEERERKEQEAARRLESREQKNAAVRLKLLAADPSVQELLKTSPEEEPPLDLKPSRLVITVVRATGLRETDGDSSDPFVKVECNNIKFRTRVEQRTVNPVWGEKFSFDVEDPSSHVSIVVQDKGIVRNEFMGMVNVPLEELANGQKIEESFTLVNKKGEEKQYSKVGKSRVSYLLGKVELELQWYDPLKQVQEVSESEMCKRDQLEVRVLKGRHLRALDTVQATGIRSSDPLVLMSCSGKERQTTCKTQTVDPCWNELVLFDGIRYPSAVLKLELVDKDLVGHDFMGQIEVPLSSLEDGRMARRWFPLKNKMNCVEFESRGHLGLQLQWVDTSVHENEAAVEERIEQMKIAEGHWVEMFDPEASAYYYRHTLTHKITTTKPENYTMATEDHALVIAAATLQASFRIHLAKCKVTHTNVYAPATSFCNIFFLLRS